MNQLTNQSLINQVKELTNSLHTIQPQNETAQLITYALVATALVGIMVYHYIKQQEESN